MTRGSFQKIETKLKCGILSRLLNVIASRTTIKNDKHTNIIQ